MQPIVDLRLADVYRVADVVHRAGWPVAGTRSVSLCDPDRGI